MKLHGIAPSPRTWQVRAVAAHLGLPLELVPLDGVSMRSPPYLALNPTGRTPTLVDGDYVLWETEAICQYLCSKVPNTLYPDDVRLRVEMTRWISWKLTHWDKDACETMIFENVVKPLFNLGPTDTALVDQAVASFHRDAPVLDAHLSKTRYMVGGQLTLVDFSVAMPLLLAEPARIPLESYPHIREWLGRMAALPAWRDTAPRPVGQAA